MYDIVVQRPGDAIYLSPGVYNQVINIGVNMAEAVNVGGSMWGIVQRLHHDCGCSGSCNSHVRPDGQHDFKITSGRRVLHPCSYPYCVSAFTRSSDLAVHEQVHKGKQIYGCQECGRLFLTLRGMIAHMNAEHRMSTEEVCPYCHQAFTQLPRHINSIHGLPVGTHCLDTCHMVLESIYINLYPVIVADQKRKKAFVGVLSKK